MKPTFLTGIVLSLALAGQAPAINLLVSNTNDSGAGSLRQCIADNAALAGGGTIIFSNIVTGTITLTNGELLITNNVTILGPGANVLAVDGNATSTVFHITDGVTVTISALTITNGNPSPNWGGGGIVNDHSTLLVSNCTLSGNVAGAGGGIYSGGYLGQVTLTVVASTFSGNSAYEGGGIYNDGQYGNATVTVITSTFSDNSADYTGGGIDNHTCAPGSATLTVVASTFSGNSAPQGGGILNDAYFCPNIRTPPGGNSTIPAGNASGATLEIGDTILNAGATGGNIASFEGTVISDGFNLSSDNGGGFLTATGDQINTDPKLGPLADHGGPTGTMALRVDSPAIDQGKSLGVVTDQRSAPRIYINPNSTLPTGGDGADIGAYEASELRITAAQKTGDCLRLDFTSWLGTNYEVQSRSDMAIGSWASLPGGTFGNGGVASATVSNVFGQSQQFYRVHPVP
jgi:hypothetical protein